MVTEYFQNLDDNTVIPPEAMELPAPQINVIESEANYGKFGLEPLEKGLGVTLGNPLRRILLSSLPGSAVTWVKIEGILHEYDIIPHVKEDVVEFLLNVKNIRLRSFSDRPGKMRLEVSGEQEVTAADIVASSDFEIVNPELHLLTLDSDKAQISIEFNVESGKGYVPAEETKGLPIGVLPVDAIFTPSRKINYNVERTRIGQVTDYERLVLEVWTDSTISPIDAVVNGANILFEHFFKISSLGKVTEENNDKATIAISIPAENYNILVEQLELSSRTLNCLKRADLNKIGEVLELERSQLLKIRNFGEKSARELYERLNEMELIPEELKSRYFGESQEPESIEDTSEVSE